MSDMSDRYTRKDADKAFLRLCEMLHQRPAESYGDVGGWQLDYNPIYGGVVVHEVLSEGGAITEPFGSMRRSPREFCFAVNFTGRALDALERAAS